MTANTDFTLGAAPHTVEDIYISGDGTNPMAGATDVQLVTAKTVMDALANHDLQVAYNNGNNITTNGNDIEFALAAGNLAVSGAGVANFDVATSVTGANTFTVGTGATTLGGTLNVTGLSTLPTVDVDGGNIDNTVIGAATAAAGTFTTVNAASVTATGNVEGATITESGNAVPNETESPNAAGDISGTYAAGLTIDNDAVQSAELDEADAYAFTGLVSFTNIDVNGGAIDGTPVGATAASTGAFTTLSATGASTLAGVTASGLVTANGGVTMGAAQNFTMGGNAVNDIYVSGDGTAPIAGATDDQLVTAKTVMDALAAHTLQTAYVNGNVITTSVGEGNVQIAGTQELDIDVNTTLDGNLTHVGNNTMTGNTVQTGNNTLTGNLTVTGTSTLTGAVTQAGGQVTLGGNVDANNGLDVAGGATVAGGVSVSSGGVAVTAGGVTVTAGGLTINAGANNFGPGVSTFGGNVVTNAVNVDGGAGSEIDNTVIGGNVAAAGTFTALTASSLALTGDLDMSGNDINNVANLSNAGGTEVTLNDDFIVTGTSDLQGVVSNTTGAVTVEDDVDFNLQAATDQVGITSSTATGTLLDVNNTNAANANYAVSILSSGTNALTVSQTANDGNAFDVTAGAGTSTGATILTSGASATAYEGTALSLENDNAATDGTAKALEIAQGSVVLSTVPAAVDATNTGTQGQYTVVELNANGGGSAFPANAPVGTVVIYVNTTGGGIAVGGTLTVNAGEAIMAVKSRDGNWYKIGG